MLSSFLCFLGRHKWEQKKDCRKIVGNYKIKTQWSKCKKCNKQKDFVRLRENPPTPIDWEKEKIKDAIREVMNR